MNKGVALAGVGLLGALLWLFSSEEAKAKPGGGGGSSSGGGGGGGGETAETLQNMLAGAVNSKDPAYMRQVADEIRATDWAGQELANAAYNKAADLDAMAKQLEDEEAQNQPYHKPANWQENWEE